MLASERQEPLGKRGGAVRALKSIVCRPSHASSVRRKIAKQHLHIAYDNGQEIVEVVGYAARELADGLHLLGLSQCCLGLAAFGNLGGDTLLQSFIQLLKVLRGLLSLTARCKQFALVATAIGRIENGDTNEEELATLTLSLDSVDQHGQSLAVAPDEFERDLIEKPLHTQ